MVTSCLTFSSKRDSAECEASTVCDGQVGRRWLELKIKRFLHCIVAKSTQKNIGLPVDVNAFKTDTIFEFGSLYELL